MTLPKFSPAEKLILAAILLMGSAAIAASAFSQINTDRCKAIYAGPRLVVTATVGLKPVCEITSAPYTRPIPSDEMLEVAGK